mmetsp:Transcript_40026/g.120623  ORF Transcript_40026/g.120623 Transcript_40026/m.120623 type:complete len:273 (-) Transcript_40026:258-1076(-)
MLHKKPLCLLFFLSYGGPMPLPSLNLGGLGKLGRAAGGPPLGDETAAALPLLGEPLGNKLLVRGGVLLVPQDRVHLRGTARPLPLKGEGGHQALDLGRLAVVLSPLGGVLPGDNVLADIILLLEVKQLPDLIGTLGSEATGDGLVGESGDGVGTSSGDDQVEHGNVVANDAPADGLALALTSPALAVSLVSLLAQEADTVVGQDTLAHGETLLVVSARDAHGIPIELVTKDTPVDFLGHAAIVKGLETLLIIDLNDLLLACGRRRDVDLHGC